MKSFQRIAACVGLLATLSLATQASAQTSKPAKADTTTKPPVDQIVAKVNDIEIHESDIDLAIRNLPPIARQVPKTQILQQVIREVIESKALLIKARQDKLDRDPEVARAMVDASERALISAELGREVNQKVTDAAIKKKYDDEIAGKPGEEEVHVRQILVATEDEAKAIITRLNEGGDFAAIAREKSNDATASRGGDVGFVKVSKVLPALSKAVAALNAGDVSQKPVNSRFGWHVIKMEERRDTATPTFDETKDELRQKLTLEAVRNAAMAAREKVKIETFNEDGTPANRPNSSIIPNAIPPVSK